MITQGEFVKLTWDTVANFVTYAIAKILELNFPCTAHSDAPDYWAIQSSQHYKVYSRISVLSHSP